MCGPNAFSARSHAAGAKVTDVARRNDVATNLLHCWHLADVEGPLCATSCPWRDRNPTSALPSKADSIRNSRHVSKVPYGSRRTLFDHLVGASADGSKLADSGPRRGIAKNDARVTLGPTCLSSSIHSPLTLYSKALSPGGVATWTGAGCWSVSCSQSGGDVADRTAQCNKAFGGSWSYQRMSG
jgi:hypothetical protein